VWNFVPLLGRNVTIVLHSTNWLSEMDWNIAISITASWSVINFLHCVEIWWDSA